MVRLWWPERCTRVHATCFSVGRRGVGDAEAFGLRAAAADMTPKQLKEHLTFPQTWGPTEWGPISFLPDHDILVSAPAANPFKQGACHWSLLLKAESREACMSLLDAQLPLCRYTLKYRSSYVG